MFTARTLILSCLAVASVCVSGIILAAHAYSASRSMTVVQNVQPTMICSDATTLTQIAHVAATEPRMFEMMASVIIESWKCRSFATGERLHVRATVAEFSAIVTPDGKEWTGYSSVWK